MRSVRIVVVWNGAGGERWHSITTCDVNINYDKLSRMVGIYNSLPTLYAYFRTCVAFFFCVQIIRFDIPYVMRRAGCVHFIIPGICFRSLISTIYDIY